MLIEQDHRAAMRRLNAKQDSGPSTDPGGLVQGYEVMHKIRKGQCDDDQGDVAGQMLFIHQIPGLKGRTTN